MYFQQPRDRWKKTGMLAARLLSLRTTIQKIGFPGWPKPNLDWDFGFGGSVQKRGLAPAPFFISLGRKASVQKMTRERAAGPLPPACPSTPAVVPCCGHGARWREIACAKK